MNPDLSRFTSIIDAQSLQSLKDLRAATERDLKSAQEAGRLLRIGIIGQIKVGKSSFLNALFFKGQDVLPKAATPMTAALTCISYSDNNEAEVEFLSIDDWNLVLQNAERAEKAKNLDIEATDIDNECLKNRDKATKIFGSFNSPELTILLGSTKKLANIGSITELTGRLDDYVGSQGKYTYLVKMSHLRLNLPELKDLEIIDTPGLNDPVQSRSLRTQHETGRCDCVFMMSRGGQFLPKQDLELLQNSLPNKGIPQENIVLVCSQFDNVLMEVSNHAECRGLGFKEIWEITLEKKMKEAKESFSSTSAELQRLSAMRVQQCRDALAAAHELEKFSTNDKSDRARELRNLTGGNSVSYFQCELQMEEKFSSNNVVEKAANLIPICLASITASIAVKEPEKLSPDELHFLQRTRQINDCPIWTPEMLMKFSGIDKTKKRLEHFRKNKSEIISNKADLIRAGAAKATAKIYTEIRKDLESKQRMLLQGDIESLAKQQQAITQKLASGGSRLASVFENQATQMKYQLLKSKATLKMDATRAAQLKTEDRTETSSSQVASSGFLAGAARFFGCGGYHTESSTTTYTIAKVHLAVSALEEFVARTEQRLLEDIRNGVDQEGLRKNLLIAAKGLFEDAGDSFSLADILAPIESAVDRVSIPDLDLDVQKHIDLISSKFKVAQVRDDEVATLRQETSRVSRLVMEEISAEVDRYLESSEKRLLEIQKDFVPKLSADLKKRSDDLQKQLADKEKNLKLYQDALVTLSAAKT